MPIISVIVPVYNVEKYLHRCVDSILAQSFTDFELILVDDGSPDNCGKICDEYAKNDSRIHVIHKENGGLSDARNVGIDWAFANSDSQWITFVDSDDWVSRKYIEFLYYIVLENNADISCCMWTDCDFLDNHTKDELVFELLSGEDFCADNYIQSQSACCRLYSKNIINGIRFPVGKLHEDVFVIPKVLLNCNVIAFIHSIPLYYIDNSNSDSITRSKWNPKRMDLLEALELELDYSKNNCYYRYYRTLVKDYIDNCYWYMICAKANGYDELLPIIRRKLRKALSIGRRSRVCPFNKNDILIYKQAYPKTVKVIKYLKNRFFTRR